MIDLHCHLLPGIDDGPATTGEALELAAAMAAAGTRLAVATPHVDTAYGLDADSIARAYEPFAEALAASGIPLEVRAGAEIALTRLADLDDGELRRLALGGSPWLLIEAPLAPLAVDFDAILLALQARGHQVLLAHPERSPALQRAPQRVAALVAAGIRCQVTASSATGRFGETVRRFTLDLLRDGLVHDIASDAHDTSRRPPAMREPLLKAAGSLPGLEDQIEWLVDGSPAAMLDGREPPPLPPLPPRRGLRRLLGS